MPVVVDQGLVLFRASGLYSAEALEKALSEIKSKEAELAAQVQEVFRSDYTTVFRRADGKEAVVALFDYAETLPWTWLAPRDGSVEKTRTDAETAARKSLMEGV